MKTINETQAQFHIEYPLLIDTNKPETKIEIQFITPKKKRVNYVEFNLFINGLQVAKNCVLRKNRLTTLIMPLLIGKRPNIKLKKSSPK